MGRITQRRINSELVPAELRRLSGVASELSVACCICCLWAELSRGCSNGEWKVIPFRLGDGHPACSRASAACPSQPRPPVLNACSSHFSCPLASDCIAAQFSFTCQSNSRSRVARSGWATDSSRFACEQPLSWCTSASHRDVLIAPCQTRRLETANPEKSAVKTSAATEYGPVADVPEWHHLASEPARDATRSRGLRVLPTLTPAGHH